MAKNMALVENGVVVNVMWCSDRATETEALIDTADRPVGIGDTYTDGKFCRDGAEILTPLEQAQNDVRKLQDENATLLSDMAQMVDEVYASDMEMMGL